MVHLTDISGEAEHSLGNHRQVDHSGKKMLAFFQREDTVSV